MPSHLIAKGVIGGFVFAATCFAGWYFLAEKSEKSKWDLLIFVQQWPYTVCTEWEEMRKEHKCRLPKNRASWTIHGIWPTKLGTMGPNFCNKTAAFDKKALDGILEELNDVWTEIYDGRSGYDFWKHEWMKHGTCALTVQQLSTELTYFKKALELHQRYNLSEILTSQNIVPSETPVNEYDVQSIMSAVKNATGKNPFVACAKDKDIGLYLLMEIRICFTKQIQLTDCDGIKSFEEQSKLTNCPLNQKIVYSVSVPKE